MKYAVYINRILLALSTLMVLSLVFVLSACEPAKSGTDIESAREDSDHLELYTCGMHPEVILEGPGQCPICNMNLTPLNTGEHTEEPNSAASGEREILYWQAPMDPSEIYDEPGKSKMGMDLVPVYADDMSSGSSISIDPVTVQNMGVRTAIVKQEPFSREIRTVGKVDYNEEKITIVSSKIAGWIEKLHVDYTGKPVCKGQALFELYSPDLVTTQQEYLLALKNKELLGNSGISSIREGAESLLNSTLRRLTYWDVPPDAIKRLEEEGIVRKTLTINSPANGIVVHKNAVEGVHIGAGTSLYKIADLSTIWVFASIYDTDLPWVEVGQAAEMELSYAPGKILKGLVAYIYPYLNEKSRDIRVRLEFPNPDMQLKPGMYANVRIKTDEIPDAIVVPSEAVIRTGERNLVFIADGSGKFTPRKVRLGSEGNEDYIHVLSGLSAGERVVTSAHFLLDSESRLQEAIQKMLDDRNNQKADTRQHDHDESDEMSTMNEHTPS